MTRAVLNDLDEYVGTAADGATFPVSRLGGRDGVPVVLVPGMCDNRRAYWTPDGSGLANHLAELGYNVWIVERRGTRGLTVPAGARRGWDEAARLDLPAAQRLVLGHSRRKAIWIGHSYGGVILSRSVGWHALDDAWILGCVLVASAVDVPLMRSRVLRRIARASIWGDPLPTRILGFGPEDEYRDQLDDMFAWCDIERASRGITADLATITVPLLEMPGNRDMLSPRQRATASPPATARPTGSEPRSPEKPGSPAISDTTHS